ncbi:MAG: hypothetical protein WBP55_06940 [Solirubrobacterales bacterium]
MSKDRSKQILREIQSLRAELNGRLDALESRMGPERRSAPPASVSSAATPSLPADNANSFSSFDGPVEKNVSVIIQPLNDLSLARVVEQALAETEGVESSTLRELRGNSAIIDARVDEGVSIISSLRRKLPVAFDVTDSDKGSFTIAMAQPGPSRTDGVAGQQVT